MLEVFLFGVLAGFPLGMLAERHYPRDRPLRLVRRFALERHVRADQPDLTEQWDLNLVTFAWWGDQCAFSNRTMCTAWRVCSDPAWRTYMHLLAQIGAVQRQARRQTRWAPGWGVRHLRQVLKHGVIAPPYPAGAPPFVGSTRAAPQSTQPATGHTEPQI